MTTSTKITIAGLDFDGPFTATSELKNQQGIYTILDKRSDEKWHMLDVGESTEVKNRVESHDRADCWRKNAKGSLAVAVFYTTGWSDSKRREKESEIRKQYGPLPCGDR